jgi:hypothetical protein
VQFENSPTFRRNIPPVSPGVLLGFFFNPEDGRAMLLQSRKPHSPCTDFQREKLFPGKKT